MQHPIYERAWATEITWKNSPYNQYEVVRRKYAPGKYLNRHNKNYV